VHFKQYLDQKEKTNGVNSPPANVVTTAKVRRRNVQQLCIGASMNDIQVSPLELMINLHSKEQNIKVGNTLITTASKQEYKNCIQFEMTIEQKRCIMAFCWKMLVEKLLFSFDCGHGCIRQ
jgi:hypothetical protein